MAFYITTPIYYVNDKPHIGHAYTSVACDVLARYRRLKGEQVKFLTGTDEHGQKVEKSAAKAGVQPQAFVDEVSQSFRELCDTMNISNDDFIRTTEDRHKTAAQAIWQTMAEKGDIYLSSYAGWYSVRDEAFYAESELVEGKAPTGAEVEWLEEPSYFFKLSEYGDKLLEFYEKNPEFVKPASRFNEVKSFVKSGLRDLSISRTSFNWGVPVPGDEKHVMYVWLDALTNYLSALGYPKQDGDYATFWPADVHMVGKDILRFHAIYWPAFLMSANLPMPKRVFAHGWWTVEGEKMSKSLGNAIAPATLVDRFGLDQVRYYMLKAMPFGNDGDFAENRVAEVVNADLANNIGNLAQRTLSMIQKNCDGQVPKYDIHHAKPEDAALLDGAVKEALTAYHEAMDAGHLQQALNAIVKLGTDANGYIDQQQPWSLKKTDLGQLAVSENERTFNHLSAEYALKPGTALLKPEGVFPRIQAEAPITEAVNAG